MTRFKLVIALKHRSELVVGPGEPFNMYGQDSLESGCRP